MLCSSPFCTYQTLSLLVQSKKTQPVKVITFPGAFSDPPWGRCVIDDRWWGHTTSPWQGWVRICSLKLFMTGKVLFRLDVRIKVPEFLGLSWKKPSSNPHTTSFELQYTHIFLSFFQFCFLFLHSHDEHLPHFILLLLEFTQEFIPLCFISLLETAKTQEKKKPKKHNNNPVRTAFHAESWVSSYFHKTSPEVSDSQERVNASTKTSPSFLDGSIGQGVKLASKNEHTSGSCKSLNSQDVLQNKQSLWNHLQNSLMLTHCSHILIHAWFTCPHFSHSLSWISLEA